MRVRVAVRARVRVRVRVRVRANTTLVSIKSFNGTSQPYGIQYTIETAIK